MVLQPVPNLQWLQIRADDDEEGDVFIGENERRNWEMPIATAWESYESTNFLNDRMDRSPGVDDQTDY